jgi:ABC-2 type transport system ATP-binding protein
MHTAIAIHIDDLVKQYGKVTALNGLSMSVQQGEVFGFLGPNGAGKTTAVKVLLGLIKPTSGRAWLLGAPLGTLAVRQRIGYLPELFRYQDWLTAREVLALHCSLARLARDRWADAIDRALELVGLAGRGNDRVGGFSKGMQQRLGLGVALLGSPDLVILDEPTSALDPVGRHDVREIIQGLKARGATVFLNSHLLTEVEHVCDRVAIVDRGQLLAVNTVAELTNDVHSVRLRLTGLEPSEAVEIARQPVVAASLPAGNGRSGGEQGSNRADHEGRTGAEAILSRFGRVSWSGGWYTVTGTNPDAVPEIVATLVQHGARIYAVESGHHTLEERFLQLLKGADTECRPASGRSAAKQAKEDAG